MDTAAFVRSSPSIQQISAYLLNIRIKFRSLGLCRTFVVSKDSHFAVFDGWRLVVNLRLVCHNRCETKKATFVASDGKIRQFIWTCDELGGKHGLITLGEGSPKISHIFMRPMA